MCWLCCCTSTVFFVFCMSGLYATEKDTVIIPNFDCNFVYFFFSICQVYFKAMFCYLSWILMSKSLLRVHLIIIMEIPSLIQLVLFSVQFSHLVMSDSLWPRGLHHARLHVNHQLSDFTQTHVRWISDAIQQSHPLSPLLLLPPIFPIIGVFWNESALHIRWPKYWSFSFSISPSSEHIGLTSFRMNCRGPAPVDPGWFEGGDGVGILGKIHI